MLVEGAGSAAEINLRAGDIANMGFARAADAPVVLVGDIDRGGVFAQLVGTKAVLAPDDAAMIAALSSTSSAATQACSTTACAYRRAHGMARARPHPILRRRRSGCRRKTR